jgi:Flp pilus assembly protein TadD
MEAAFMSMTLNLADRVLRIGRNLQEVGRASDALRMLERLAGWKHLPAEVAEETHACLAEIRMRHSQFAHARRHLAALLVLEPDNPRYHYLLAATFDPDKRGSGEAAYEHYRRSLELDPNQADCLSDLGLLALRLGKDEEGLQALRRAVELAPDDLDVVGKLAVGLGRCGKLEEARLTLRAALFRNSRNPAFRKLWNDFRFRQVCADGEAARQMDEASPQADESALLPFLSLVGETAQTGWDRKRVRPDRASTLSPPHRRGSARASDQKRA